MVHGFIHQSGGYMQLDSQPEKGTSMSLFLPRTTELPPREEVETAYEATPKGNGQVIFVIEDNAAIRKLALRSLDRLGYKTIDGGNGTDIDERLKIHEESEKIELFFSDIILPNGINGLELANRFKSTHPMSKILLMTGYAGASIKETEETKNTFPIIQKPFNYEDLARKVHQTLSS